MLDRPALLPDAPMQPGQLLARGVARHLRDHDFCCLEEFVPDRGLRIDVMAMGPKSEFWVIECKSSRADFMSDLKWRNYLPFADRFFFAVDCDFPTEILPGDVGLIIGDAFGAEVIRMPEGTPLPQAKRRKLTVRFARTAAQRLHWARDPMLRSAS
ncbi:MmcB family DNA repair protein [Jannaschia sp. W003]|uniref:MmcB family DNA repair protein n=1 Tax=Jannaschia sp. W003 TaxID=2867012 RepID=UPI0021A5F201|nr:MmcB family DNA repair protein [Jannaschia sp. W003]UWQ22673.1 MmcB family DNA repair protein [Jannaschia sp. W003]